MKSDWSERRMYFRETSSDQLISWIFMGPYRRRRIFIQMVRLKKTAANSVIYIAPKNNKKTLNVHEYGSNASSDYA